MKLARSAGETVLIGCRGRSGSRAPKIAKLRGCNVVGIVGSEKAELVTNTLGANAAVITKPAGSPHAISQACPEGVDVYFDNVGAPR
ncbi:MAG: hypothetical protein CM15mP103_05240 [Gammaproteobacteria bacterium]|nr:MAG: hypothetical protein CM15mP103_05240 [Gammaproteobacteria bacterium]